MKKHARAGYVRMKRRILAQAGPLNPPSFLRRLVEKWTFWAEDPN